MDEPPHIDNVIAEDTWFLTEADGTITPTKVIVGRPQRDEVDWSCPVFIQGFTSGVVAAAGIGPVDSLMNAMTLVNRFFEANKDRFEDQRNARDVS